MVISKRCALWLLFASHHHLVLALFLQPENQRHNIIIYPLGTRKLNIQRGQRMAYLVDATQSSNRPVSYQPIDKQMKQDSSLNAIQMSRIFKEDIR